MRPRILLLYVCFFVSGASALIYEVVWQRMLTLVFGLTSFSVAAVLSAFLAGLAVGARSFGRLADRSTNPIRLYAGIELGIAVAGLASGHFIPPLMRAFTALHSALQPGWFGSNLIRFALAFAAVGLASVLIGATVPVMARLVAERAGSVGVGFGRLYAVNTIGSVAGAMAAGFLLIRTLGVQAALLCAVIGNVAAAGLALAIAGQRAGAKRAAPTDSPAAGGHEDRPSYPRFALVVAAAAGAVALAYEVAWMRLIAVFTLNSVYVFTMVVSVYLTALAAGAGIAARLMRGRCFDPVRALVVVQMLLALMTPVLLGSIPAANQLDLTRTDALAGRIFMLEYALSAAVVFVPTVLIGMTLPLLVGTFAGSARSVAESGRLVGRVYAWNSVGTILGASTTGVLLVPLLGLRGTLLGAAAMSFMIAAAAAAMVEQPSRFWRAIAPAGAGCFALLLAVMPTTTRFYCPLDPPNETVLYYAEGPSATVHVAEFARVEGNHRSLFIDSKSVAGTDDEIVTDQKMLAHLPLLLHPDPQRVLTVGFGTGGTSYSMLLHRARVDCVEIEPRVVDAYRFFTSENHGMVGPNHERLDFHLVLNDARSWLHVAPHLYDVIVTDVTSIQYRGSGNLYTTDYFRLMQSRLRPEGLGCAWVPATGITSDQLKVLIRTFQNVYPHTSVWYMINLPTDFLILVGTPDQLRVDLNDVTTRMSHTLVQRDLALVGLDNPYKLAACLLLAEADVTRYVGPGPVHTDDRPILDYMAHASPYRNTLTQNLIDMLACRSDAAAYIVAWPATRLAQDVPATWRRWHTAARYLIKGHALLHCPDPDRAPRVRAAYQAAADLAPHDALIQSLVRGLSPVSAGTGASKP